jgi:hypothetical protein
MLAGGGLAVASAEPHLQVSWGVGLRQGEELRLCCHELCCHELTFIVQHFSPLQSRVGFLWIEPGLRACDETPTALCAYDR